MTTQKASENCIIFGMESKIQNNICILLRSTKVYLFLVQKLWTVGGTFGYFDVPRLACLHGNREPHLDRRADFALSHEQAKTSLHMLQGNQGKEPNA